MGDFSGESYLLRLQTADIFCLRYCSVFPRYAFLTQISKRLTYTIRHNGYKTAGVLQADDGEQEW
jgi:hypothetical protein